MTEEQYSEIWHGLTSRLADSLFLINAAGDRGYDTSKVIHRGMIMRLIKLHLAYQDGKRIHLNDNGRDVCDMLSAFPVPEKMLIVEDLNDWGGIPSEQRQEALRDLREGRAMKKDIDIYHRVLRTCPNGHVKHFTANIIDPSVVEWEAK